MKKYQKQFIVWVLVSISFLYIEGLSNAEGLSRSDKLRVLYSNQFAFDRRGIPLITIGIVEGAKEVRIDGDLGLRVLPDGEDGSEIEGSSSWTIRLLKSKLAEVEHFVVLEHAAISEISKLQEVRNRWKTRGIEVQILEVGTIFGLKGRVFDNRAFVIVGRAYRSLRAAKEKAEDYYKKGWTKRVSTIDQLKKRPSALLLATNTQQNIQIKVKDAIWFSPKVSRGRLSVRANRQMSVSKKKKYYWGQLYVTVDRHGKLAVVNAVAADKLLAGLVPSEIFPSAPIAALKAQAVAARSDLLAKIGTRHFVDPYLICSWQHCQVYRGAGHEHPRTTKAINETRGLVLARKSGGLVHAVYHAVSGGFTENNEHVWPGDPDPVLRGKLDAPESALVAFRNGINEKNLAQWLSIKPQSWTSRSRLNQNKIRWKVFRSIEMLNAAFRSRGIGPVRGIDVLERGRSGRAKLIKVEGALKSIQIRGELSIRRALGNLRSSMFIVKARVNGAVITGFDFIGGGWGHGVGMCQTGAIGMAKSHKNFKAILHHYYSSIDIRRLF